MKRNENLFAQLARAKTPAREAKIRARIGKQYPDDSISTADLAVKIGVKPWQIVVAVKRGIIPGPRIQARRLWLWTEAEWKPVVEYFGGK